MTAELMHDYNISATALGNFSAFYFYSYVSMQIPTGILADIWGPRRLLTTGAFIAGTGILLFVLIIQVFVNIHREEEWGRQNVIKHDDFSIWYMANLRYAKCRTCCYIYNPTITLIRKD